MQNCVLLSIKPQYVNSIIKGEKQFEFRKKIFKSPMVERVYIYASAPIKKIVGYFELKKIINGSPIEVWEKCSQYGGIEEKDFFEYYKGKDKAYSLQIDNLAIFNKPICPYTLFEKFTPPQSFMYFNHNIEEICSI